MRGYKERMKTNLFVIAIKSRDGRLAFLKEGSGSKWEASYYLKDSYCKGYIYADDLNRCKNIFPDAKIYELLCEEKQR